MIPKSEATILGYKILFDAKGNLITERISVDIKKLKKYLNNKDFNVLRSTLLEAKTELDQIHDKIELASNARK